MLRLPDHPAGVARLANAARPRAGLLRCDKNENLFPVPEEILAEIRAGLTGEFITSYPHLAGLYADVARLLALPEERLYFTAGSDAGIKAVFEVFVPPGGGVVVPQPSYAMYRVYSELFRAVLQGVPYPDSLQLTAADIMARCDAATKLVVIANPDSPTGSVLPRGELLQVVRAAGERGLPVLVDEAYYPYHPETLADELADYDNLIITRTFSKAWGLASARLGLVLAAPAVIDLLRRWRPMYEAGGFAALAGAVMLKHQDWVLATVRETVAVRDWLAEELRARGRAVRNTAANFLHLRAGTADEAASAAAALAARGILVGTGSAPNCLRGWLRLTIGPRADMQRLLAALDEILPLPGAAR